jgi:site-specific DNA recombinase
MTARLRCAIYTRKSTEEGLDQDFNSLDAQREACEAYVASQKHEGWAVAPDRYDDGGYTGGNMDRPALKRLLSDVEAGKIDVIVLYKIDRLSRSLLDFTRMIELFERKKVTFVSVTQQFNTSNSMGRLMLHILLSFAQFEREIISERTRDKMSAARRKGKWIGGRPPLGYDIADKRLVVNTDEAEQVRAIFTMYLEEKSLLRVAEILNGRGWRMKTWSTRKNRRHGGGEWDKAGVQRIITNAVYVGKVEYRGEVYPGQHRGIVDDGVFARAAAILESHRQARADDVRNTHGFLLRGLLRCQACGSVMTSTFSTRKEVVYRYYTCTLVARRGRGKCPVRSVSAEAIERFVVARVHALGRSPEVVEGVVTEVARLSGDGRAEFEQEERRLVMEYQRLRGEYKQALGVLTEQQGGDGAFVRERLAEIEQRAIQIDGRVSEIRSTLEAAERGAFTHQQITAVLNMFVPVWDALSSTERARILRLLIERIDYDGVGQSVEIHLHGLGVKLLAREAADAQVTRS